jgi:hypothetical protein
MVELLRRSALVFCVCSAAWLVFYAPLDPLVSVKPVDFALKYEKAKPAKRSADSLLAEDITPPVSSLKEFISKATEGRLIAVEGKEWEDFFQNVTKTHEGISAKKEWLKRASAQYRGAGLYFKADESPLKTVKDNLLSDSQRIYFSLKGNKEAEYLELTYHKYSHAKFHIGTGLTDYPAPPSWLFYPYRKFSLWIALGGFIFYFLAPKRKKQKGSIHFKKWFITGNDLAFSLLLIAPPFIAPLAIIGGSVQVFFTEGIFLLPIFWLIAFIGAWGLVFIMPRFASFEMDIDKNGLKVISERGERNYPFTDMRRFQPVTFKRPRWLILFAWLAFLSGRSGGFSTLFLSTLKHAGIGILLKDGSALYINTSNPVGMDVLNKKSDDIVKILQNAGVEEKNEELVVRTLGLEPVGIKNPG